MISPQKNLILFQRALISSRRSQILSQRCLILPQRALISSRKNLTLSQRVTLESSWETRVINFVH